MLLMNTFFCVGIQAYTRYARARVCVCVRVCVCASVWLCARATYVDACVCLCAHVCACAREIVFGRQSRT